MNPPKTAEQVLADLHAALGDARQVTRDMHAASRDFRRTVKTERARIEQITREETARAVAAIADDVRAYLQAGVDTVLAEVRQRLLGDQP